MTRILVDADACPVKSEILDVALPRGIPVVLVASYAHEMQQGQGVETIQVESAPQAADIALTNATRRGDIVVTGDYGVACMVLGRGARALSFRGQIYDDRNIEGLMASRHMAAKARRGGGRSRGPRPFTTDDARRFREQLQALVDAASSSEGPAAGPG